MEIGLETSLETLLKAVLLGGLSPQQFMRRHWQKKPLLVRQAVPGGLHLVGRSELFDLAAHDEVESRLVVRRAGRWSLRHGPLKRRALPPLKQREWTLLVQGLDLHVPAARALLEHFRFVPDARLDDAMLSFATDGGGVGPHVDSYDVFLLQVQGRRRWRIGRVRRPEFVPGVPLKILSNFEAGDDWLLEPGDMLYLPPGWAHDGVAVGECLTCSIGFRAAGRDELARDVLQRLIDAAEPDARGPLYRDPQQSATAEPARIPAGLRAFTTDAVARLAGDATALACALGEVLSEPKRGVWFDHGDAGAAPEPEPDGGLGSASRRSDAGPDATRSAGVQLDPRTRALYDDRHLFINGESFRAAGRDATLMRRLADRRVLGAADVGALGDSARALLDDWVDAGWVRRIVGPEPERRR